MPLSHVPYWRLSGFYFFYFASIGVLVPYWSIYLQWEGFSASEIGELTAVMLGTRLIAPYVWGWIADHKGQRMRIVQSTSFIAAVSFSAIFIEQSYWWIALVTLFFSFFWNASLPQFEVNTLQHLGQHSHYYSRIRLWGSVGFIVIVVLMGKLLEIWPNSIVPIAMFISILGIWLVSMTVPESASRHMSLDHTPLRDLLKKPAIMAFLLVCLLSQASHGPYYTFYSIYLEQHGYRSIFRGQLWAVGVIAEVIIFLFMHRWLPRFGIRKVLLASMLLTSIRWVLIALFPENLIIMLFAQIMHAATFGTYHAAAIAWVHKHFTGKHQGRGQALYSSFSFGAGGALGSLLSGYFWITPGPTITFLIAALLSFLGFLIGLRWLK